MRKFLFCVVFTGAFSLQSLAQQSTVAWSSRDCGACESTILPGFYPDGSGVFQEVINGKDSLALVGVLWIEGDFVVALGYGNTSSGSLVLRPKDAITIETDSSSRMVLHALDEPDSKIAKHSTPVEKRIKKQILSLKPSEVTGGYLFFPADLDASSVTVVIRTATETFRFPFVRDPRFPSKFQDPAKRVTSAVIDPPQPAKAAPGPVQGPPVTLALSSLASGQPPVAPDEKSDDLTHHGSCTSSVTFAIANGGGLEYRLPKIPLKWFEKTKKKFGDVCFPQLDSVDNDRAGHYFVAISTSMSAFRGLYPVYHTSISTTTSPVSGNGTITSQQTGAVWDYTYNGTVTTTSTTTQRTDTPYADTTYAFYAYAYNETGRLLGTESRSQTVRQGGDGLNTLGYNLGSMLVSGNIRERLVEAILRRILNH